MNWVFRGTEEVLTALVGAIAAQALLQQQKDRVVIAVAATYDSSAERDLAVAAANQRVADAQKYLIDETQNLAVLIARHQPAAPIAEAQSVLMLRQYRTVRLSDGVQVLLGKERERLLAFTDESTWAQVKDPGLSQPEFADWLNFLLHLRTIMRDTTV